MGFNNLDIKHIVEAGIDPDFLRYANKQQLLGLKMGDEGQGVWEIQDLLLKKSYDIPFDGVFGIETQESLVDFQKKNNLIPSGIVNKKTLKVLIE
ncbi:MAG: peptidoglycan-binding protein [Cytophagales bacterium]|nr:peptidoglycan-binding protein [Cytophagales bacterium]